MFYFEDYLKLADEYFKPAQQYDLSHLRKYIQQINVLKEDRSLLHSAALVIKLILEHCDIESRDSAQCTPLSCLLAT